MKVKNVVVSLAILLAGVLAAAAVLSAAMEPLEPPEPPQHVAHVMFASHGSFLGIGVAEINSERARALNLKEERGVEVTQVENDSPAAKAGVKKGDIVLEFNGHTVEGTDQFVRLVRETPEGRTVKLVINRGGATQTLTAVTATRKPMSAMRGMPGMDREFRWEMPEIRIPDLPRPYMGMRSSMMGVEVEALDTQLAEFFGVKEGMLVRSVLKGSAAEKAGIKAGDVITKLDGQKVATARDITSAVRAKQSQATFPVMLVRERREMTVNVTLDAPQPPRPHKAPTAPAAPRSRNVILQDQL